MPDKTKEEYTEEEWERMGKKWIPNKDTDYLVTDSCFWDTHPPEDYNEHDEDRAPHSVQLVDVNSGTIVNLPSGSIIRIVEVEGNKQTIEKQN